MTTRKNHVGKLVFAKPMAGTVSRVSRANSEDELTEDTGRLINAHMTAKGEDAAMQTVITAEDAMPTVPSTTWTLIALQLISTATQGSSCTQA